MHEMRLAQTYAAVDEKGVVGVARIRAHLHRCRAGKLVRFPFHEIVEGEFRSQPCGGGLPVAGPPDRGGAHRVGCGSLAGGIGLRRLVARAGSDLHRHVKFTRRAEVGENLADAVAVVLRYPVTHKVIGG